MAKKENPKKVAASGSILDIPVKNLVEYIKFFQKNNLRELTIQERGTTISLKKDEPPKITVAEQRIVSAPVTASPLSVEDKSEKKVGQVESVDENYEKITTPIMGTFYEAPSPGAEPFVKEGQTVKKGDVLCIIEAMKVMNRITAEFDCKIIKKVAKNAQPLKSGDVIFLVEKT